LSEDRLLGFVGLALRARRAVLGRAACKKAARARRLYALVVASDAGSSAARDAGADDAIPVVRLALDRTELGALVQRDSLAVLGITDPNLAAGLTRAARPDDTNESRR
jgi:ribosomal protein L7Ae-like RNA K-turn-binding protein